MPPKKNQPSKKTEQKKKDKIVEDKTFGLKNKNKSKTVQSYIKGVAHQVNFTGKSVSKIEDEQFTNMKQKKREEEEKALLASLFKQVAIVKKDEEGNIIKDKSQIICPYFKQGLCQKGKKCKFSHDLAQFKETEEIDLYVDQRKQLFGDVPEQTTQTKIVCNHFLDAVEQGKYGWNWMCPNGMECIYRHCLPMGFELKKGQPMMQEDEEPLEDRIEEERNKVDSKGTKLTLEVFLKWKEQKKLQRKEKEEKKKDADIKKLQSRGGASATIMSGRSLFAFNPNLFVDDDEAVEEKEYEERNDNMDEEEDQENQIIEEAKDAEEEQKEEEKEEKQKQKEEEEEEEWDEKYIVQKIAELTTYEPQQSETIQNQKEKDNGQETKNGKIEKKEEQKNEEQNQKIVTTQNNQVEVEAIEESKKKKKKKNKKKKQKGENVQINEDLFLDEPDNNKNEGEFKREK